MKKYLLLIPSLIYPYFMLFLVFAIFTQFKVDIIFPNNNGLLAIVYLAILFIVSLMCNIIFIFLSVKQKWKAESIAKANMVIKLLQVLAYLAIFILGVLCLLTIFTFALTIVFICFDLLAIFLTGMNGCTAVYRCYKEGNVSKMSAVINGFLQFMFCADIVSAIFIYMKSKSNKYR